MLGHVRCGASICTLVQRPDRVKGGPGEKVPGPGEVGIKETAAENEALLPSRPGVPGAGLCCGAIPGDQAFFTSEATDGSDPHVD